MWKTCRNNKYEVSTSGQVRNKKTNKILHQYLDRYGYYYVAFYENGKQKKYKVHRLVAEAFLGDIDGNEIDHIDTNRTNNLVTNLRIVSRKENANNPNTIKNLTKYGSHYAKLYGKAVKHLGTTYPSIIEASRRLGIPRSNIQYHLRNNTGVFVYE